MCEQSVTTQSSGQSIDQNKGRIYPCEQCGADLKFYIGQQDLKCPFCGFEKTLTVDADAHIEEQNFRAMLIHLSEVRKSGVPDEDDESNQIRCDSCAATVVFQGTLTSSECPFCGSPIQRANVHKAEDRVPADAVLPFGIDEKQARANLAVWVKARWFAPGEFKKHGAAGKFNGVYLPFWTYDSFTHNSYRGERGEHYYITIGSGKNRRRVRRTRWYPANGQFNRFFDDVLVVATGGIQHALLGKLEPWPFDRLIPFNSEVLAGFYAQTYDIELDAGFAEARKRIDQAIYAETCSRIGGDTQRVHDIRSNYNPITYKHLLLPTWLLAYRYGGKSYQVVVNAMTGEVQGERPWSWTKIILLVVVILVVVGVIVLVASGF